jgi:hypothetical protein
LMIASIFFMPLILGPRRRTRYLTGPLSLGRATC